MKKIVLLLLILTNSIYVFSQKSSIWKKVNEANVVVSKKIRTTTYSENQILFNFDRQSFIASLSNVANRFSGLPGVQIALPNAAGEIEQFLVWENSNFEPELQAQYPEIRAYVGKGISDVTAKLNFSISPNGIQTMILRADKGAEFIEPFTTDNSVYVLFDSKTRTKGNLPFVCSTADVALSQKLMSTSELQKANNQVMKTMRLALSCTGEYGAYFGGTIAGALAAMNATMTRVNGVYEMDMALHLNIIANNNVVIYTDAANDPYSDAANLGNWNSELQNTLTNVIGESNYDIGHLFGATGGGGNAGCIGCVCDNGKGSAYTSPSNGIPQGDTFDIDYVAHEMGHQLGGNHTFSHSAENNAVNVEPGSGSTIMAYAGITGATDVQSNSDPYFTYRSILQMQTNLLTKTCPVSVPLTNTPPVINAGLNYTIPNGTAFVLTGSGTDAQGDTISYCWEQNDDATIVGAAASYPAGTKTDGPNFRSRNPIASPVRFFPAYNTVLSGSLSNTWEAVSTVARTLNFTLTGRDNNPSGPQTQTATMAVNVSGTAGPFTITSPNVENTSWTQGSTQTITWNVAGTTANGINTANVNILFSSDGGATFTTLVANTPNDGSQVITVPNIAAPFCRIKIEPIGNIYYAISKSVAVGYTVTVTNTCNTYTGVVTNATIAGPNTQFFVLGNVNVPAANNVVISDLNMSINITHPRINDLYIALVKPNSTTVDRILYQQGCSTFITNNMITTFDDSGVNLACAGIANNNTYKPLNTLDVFNGGNSAGLWRLAIADVTAPNNGTLNSWSLNICSTTTTVTLGSETFSFKDFALYPNPNNGNFTVQFESPSTDDVKIGVYDLRGRQIFAKTYANSGIFNQEINLNSVEAGVYLVKIDNGTISETKKISIE